MVSSTFYDLQEIRQQLSKMLRDDLGYTPLISESATFPIEPSADAVENCRRRVENDADVLVLLIGNRYGSITEDSGKSVTNLEYLAARAKGIPIYVYIDGGTLTLFEAWKKASLADKPAVAKAVEDSRVFDFIERVRTADGVWTNTFKHADDITNSLRFQLGCLMMSGLNTQAKLRAHPDRSAMDSLSPQSFRLAVEQPRLWEYLLFASALKDATDSFHAARREYDLSLTFGIVSTIDDDELPGWSGERLSEIITLVQNAGILVNTELPKALGPPGESGEMRDIVFVATEMGKVYMMLLEWTQRVKLVKVPDEYAEFISLLSGFSADAIQKLGSWGAELLTGIRQAIEDDNTAPLPSGEKKIVNFSLVFAAPASDRFTEALHAALRKRGLGAVVDHASNAIG